ncbi:unnamed protein product, partial [Allacma fusca]
MDLNSNSIRKKSWLKESGTDPNADVISKNEMEKNKSKLQLILSNVTIEPVMFMQMFGFALVQVITQNFYIDRICRVKLENSVEICENLTRNHHSDDIS